MKRLIATLLIVAVTLLPNYACSQMLSATVGASSTAAPTGIVHIQGCGYEVIGSGSSVSCTLPSPVTANDFLFICTASVYGIPGPVFSGDTGTLTSLPHIGNVLYANNNYASCYYIHSAVGGGTTMTETFSGTYASISVDEFRSVGTLDVDNSTTAAGTGVTSLVSNSITTTANGDLVLGAFAVGGCNTSYSAGTGFTLGGNSTSVANEYMIQSTAGSVTAIASNNAACNGYFIYAGAFKHQ